MIRYQLLCEHDHEFEGWFSSSADYDRQEAEGLIPCALCGNTAVRKAVMAPAVARRDRGAGVDLARIAAEVQAKVRDHFEYVGESFASEARAIHEGEAPDRPIWGQTTGEEARALIDDGVPVAPLPAPFAPPPPTKVN